MEFPDRGDAQVGRLRRNDLSHTRECVKVRRYPDSNALFAREADDLGELLVQHRFAPVIEVDEDLFARVLADDLLDDGLISVELHQSLRHLSGIITDRARRAAEITGSDDIQVIIIVGSSSLRGLSPDLGLHF